MLDLQQKWILLMSFFVHCIFLISIFDIYFKSPVVDGIEPVHNEIPGTARRLILFVGDGLRANSFFQPYEKNKFVAPYLRQVMKERGRWGVSHTRVPTESRPGHVALIAGFYEDPSAIFKGWKDNPIEFDSVFNRSSLTFGWGSPDILNMFVRGSSTSKVFMNTYPSTFQEFSGKEGSSIRLSLWAFENFKTFLENAKSNNSLAEMLRRDRLIFFIHLLGIDTAGHSHKPHSEEYLENIKIADNIAKETEILINQFYENDNRSVFVFTSDHGMTDWGSHGEGSRVETEIPYVTWGAGILKPKFLSVNHNPVSWGLSYLQRNDISQTDTVPLISVLLGINIPINSIGVLPIDILDYSNANKSAAIFLNARQILAHFTRKRKIIEQKTVQWLYKPYKLLADGNDKMIVNELEKNLKNGNHDEVIKGSKKLIDICLEGLSYYHNYYQSLLLVSVSSLYIGWICWVLLSVCSNGSTRTKRRLHKSAIRKLRILNALFIAAVSVTSLLISVQFLPYQYYLYCCLPLCVWWDVIRQCLILSINFRYSISYSSAFTLLGTAIGAELVVAAFFERRTLSLVLFFIMLWPVFSIRNKKPRTFFLAMWILSCSSLMVFPFLPVIGGRPNNTFLSFCAVLWCIFLFVSSKLLHRIDSANLHSSSSTISHLFYVLFSVALANVLYVTFCYETKRGLSYFNQFISWIILLSVPIMPLLSSRKLIKRLLNLFFCFGVVSLLFAVTHDALFLPLFSFHLFLWFLMENILVNDYGNSTLLQKPYTKFSKTTSTKSKILQLSDFRSAFLFFFYTVFSFFGTGNVASINSFDTTWVRCFITLFAPFTMMALILIKLVIPFLVTACTFRAVINVTKVNVDKIFLIVLIYCDVMGLNFLFLVKNVGSWLEIGSSVSHYVISQTIILFLVLLYTLSGYLTSSKIKSFKNVRKKFKLSIVKYED